MHLTGPVCPQWMFFAYLTETPNPRWRRCSLKGRHGGRLSRGEKPKCPFSEERCRQRWRSRRTCSALRRWVPLCLLGFWWTKRLALWGCCWPKLLGSKRKRGANRWRYRWHFVSGTLGVCRWVAVPSRNWIPIRRTRLLRKYWIERKGEARSVRYYDNYISQTSEFIIHEENTKEYHNLDAYIT